jgi:cell division protein FtsQ
LLAYNSGHLKLDLHWLKIREVKVQAQWPLTPQGVLSKLPPLVGKNLFSLNADEIVEKIQKNPWVDKVTLKKQYPDLLWIEVLNREPASLLQEKGNLYFVDDKGEAIEKVTPSLLGERKFPLLSYEFPAEKKYWNYSKVLKTYQTISQVLAPDLSVSQLVMGRFPYFKIYLSQLSIEILFSQETWESQLPVLRPLLLTPPTSVTKPNQINLVTHKKAVVRSILSK